jgi:membrane-associated phospholipid phosphatase
MSIALALSGALVLVALLVARWVKVSLHAAFAAFATTLLWPITLAVAGGVLVTAAVVWSRLVLRRHVAADVMAGLVLGVAAGGGYHVWVA